MKVAVYNLKKEQVGELELSDEVFAADVQKHLLHEVTKAQLASRRAGTQATKERSAVAGTTKKMFRQKGTGRARMGGIRSASRVGGGMAHALLPRDYSYRPPRKVRIKALQSALSLVAQEGRLVVLEDFALSAIKTGALARTLGTLQVDNSLVVDSATNSQLALSLRNLKKHQFLPPEGVNVYDVLRHKQLVVTKGAAKALEARCLGLKRAGGDSGQAELESSHGPAAAEAL